MDLQGFDATQVEPRAAYEPVPAGEYTIIIADSEEKTNAAQTSSYLKLTVEIVDGPYKGRKIFDNLNLNHDKADVREIAQRTLSAICHAVGVVRPRRSEELHNKPMRGKIGVRPARDGYDASNVVKGYEPLNKTAAPAPETTAAKAPWKR